MKYVHPFIFALCTIIPMEPDEVCLLCAFVKEDLKSTKITCILLIINFPPCPSAARCCVKVLGLCVRLCSWCRPSMETLFSPTSRSRSSTNWQMTAMSWTLRPTWVATWRRWSQGCSAVTSPAVSKWYISVQLAAGSLLHYFLYVFSVTVCSGVLTEPSCLWLPHAKSWENDASCHRGRGENPFGASHQL